MTTETDERSWTNPKLSGAHAAHLRAEQRHGIAESILKRRREDREKQEKAEAAIRAAGLEPVLFDPFMPAIEQTQYQERLVRVHVSDEALATAEQQVAETKAVLEAARVDLEAARRLKPVRQSVYEAKAKKAGGAYQALKHLRIGGRDYWPGEILTAEAVRAIERVKGGYLKLERWQHGQAPTLRRID